MAQEADREEEEAFMKRALAESEKLDADRREKETEEEELVRKAIEASMREEEARKAADEEAKLEDFRANQASMHAQFQPPEEEEPQNP